METSLFNTNNIIEDIMDPHTYVKTDDLQHVKNNHVNNYAKGVFVVNKKNCDVISLI
jgi:hypothetical protein